MTSTPEVSPDHRGYRPRRIRRDLHLTTDAAPRLVELICCANWKDLDEFEPAQQWAADTWPPCCAGQPAGARPPRRRQDRWTRRSCPALVARYRALAGEGFTGSCHRRNPHRRRRRPPVAPVPRLRGHDPAVRHQPRHRRFTNNQAGGHHAPSKYKCAAQAAAGGRCKGLTEFALVLLPVHRHRGASTNSTHSDSCSAPDHGSHPHSPHHKPPEPDRHTAISG